MKNFLENENMVARIVSFLLACGLWLYVMSEQNPIIEREYLVQLKKNNLPENMVVLNVPASVKVKVSGQRSTLGAISDEDIDAFIDCGGRTVGAQHMPVMADFGEGTVQSIYPESVHAYLDTIGEKKMLVEPKVIGLPSKDYELGECLFTPKFVMVKGASNYLEKLDKVVATIDVSDNEESFELECGLAAVTKTGAELPDLEITPSKVMVKASLVKRAESAMMPVIVTTSGELSDGRRFVRAECVPSQIEVTTIPSVLENMVNVHTKEVDLGKIAPDSDIMAELELPEGVFSEVNAVKVKLITE